MPASQGLLMTLELAQLMKNAVAEDVQVAIDGIWHKGGYLWSSGSYIQ